MDETIKSVIIGAVIIAAVATGIAVAVTYWYVFVALGLAVWGLAVGVMKIIDKRNQV